MLDEEQTRTRTTCEIVKADKRPYLMDVMHCILACGRDQSLLDTRRMVLESAGYRVRVATEAEAAIKILLDEPIALMVLCHTLSSQDCLTVLAALHSYHPEARVVALQSNKAPCEANGMVQVVSVFDGPGKMLLKVQELMNTRSSAKTESRSQLTPYTA